MEVTSGQAVEYEVAGQRLWAVVETVQVTQVQRDRWTGKELILARNHPTPSCSEAEVYLSPRPVHGQKAAIRQVKSLRELRSWATDRTGFLWRRRFNPESGVFDPAVLPTSCVCPLPIHPDQPFVVCEECTAVLHPKCVSDALCPKCAAVLPVKRPHSPLGSPILTKNRKTDQRCPFLQLSKYTLLSPLTASDLANSLHKLAEESSKLTDIDPIRQGLRDKFLAALLLSRAELRSKDSVSSVASLATMTSTASEIEVALFFSSDETVSSQKYRLRARTLVFNLLDEKNPDLRAAVLKGNISPHELVFMDSKDMASGQMKKEREKRERQYVEEQLIKQVEEDGHREIIVGNGGGKEPEKDGEPTLPVLPLPDPSLNRLQALVLENSPSVLAPKIRQRLEQYLQPDQVQAVLKAAEIDYV